MYVPVCVKLIQNHMCCGGVLLERSRATAVKNDRQFDSSRTTMTSESDEIPVNQRYFDEGRAAAKQGLSSRANPYRELTESVQYRSWFAGHSAETVPPSQS